MGIFSLPDEEADGKHGQELSPRSIKEDIEANNKKVAGTKDAKAIKDARLGLAKKLKLGDRLYDFFDEIKYYPAWYENDKNFNSQEIEKADIQNLKFSKSFLKDIKEDLDDFSDSNDELLSYRFKNGDNKYDFIVNRAPREQYYDSESEYHIILVFNEKKKIILKARMIMSYSDYDNSYSHTEIEVFKPDNWLVSLMNKMSAVAKENEGRLEEYEKKQAEEDAEKIKRDFL